MDHFFLGRQFNGLNHLKMWSILSLENLVIFGVFVWSTFVTFSVFQPFSIHSSFLYCNVFEKDKR